MKKLCVVLSIISLFAIMGCGTKTNTDSNEMENDPKREKSVGQKENDDNEKADLTLQVLKQDQDDGITVENNPIYQAIQQEVEADPKMGEADDISLYPFDLVELEDGSTSLLLLIINRLDKPIRNLVFHLTFGKDDGDYIFDGEQVDLPEGLLGLLEKDGIVPVFIEIDDEDIELFTSLTTENMFLELDNVGIDFTEENNEPGNEK